MVGRINKRSLLHKTVILFCYLFTSVFQSTVYGANIDIQLKKKDRKKQINPSEVVKVTSRGEGKDRDEAINMALRDALERTNHSFVSSVSLFSDDEISYDEIARVSKGNIAKFDVIYVGIDGQGRYSALVDAYVSATNLADYVENQGGGVRIKGFDFVQNHMQKLKLALFYKENELTAIYNLFIELCRLSGKMYDYSIESESPIVDSDNKHVKMRLKPCVKNNRNYFLFKYCLEKTLKSLSIPNYEIEAYKSLNLGGPYEYYCNWSNDIYEYDIFYLRNKESVYLLKEYIRMIEEYGKNDCVIENNLGKKILVNSQNIGGLDYKCTMEEFSNLESFSIIPSANSIPFAVCKDTLANIIDKVKVSFSGLRLGKMKYPDMTEHDSKVSDVIYSNYIYERNIVVGSDYRRTNYKNPGILVELDSATLTLIFCSPYLYNYSVQGNAVKVWNTIILEGSRIFRGGPIGRYEATITKSSGIGFLNNWMPTKKTKALTIKFENGEDLIINVSSKLYFESFVYNGKKCVRPVLSISIPLDYLDVNKYAKYSYAERKRMFSRLLCLYNITDFHIDTNELWFKSFNGAYKKSPYWFATFDYYPDRKFKRDESGDVKGFSYPQRTSSGQSIDTPDADFFLNIFYKKGTKDNSLESYGLAKVSGL